VLAKNGRPVIVNNGFSVECASTLPEIESNFNLQITEIGTEALLVRQRNQKRGMRFRA
jgi:protoheme ferro-lyase